jgi:uncharacterized membrane protein YraQ (UPF0718 family)
MNKKRIFIIFLLVAGIAGYFWTQSRYPSLNRKAMMAETMHTQGLSFGVIYEIHAGDPWWKRVAFSTVNWVNTNLQGMTFSVFFGAAILTLLKLIHRKETTSYFTNSLQGLVTGTPLGVCANCVAPIGKGMYESGERVETVLSAMVSSPTLNIVVLTMIFGLFPFPFAMIKVAATLLLALVVVPLAAKWMFKNENKKERTNKDAEVIDIKQESWVEALKGSAKMYWKDLGYITKTTVPLMFLAGFLGALVVETIPLRSFAFLSENPLMVMLLAVVGTLIPAPITFDVIVAFALNSAGLSLWMTMIFLFTAGTFSIYQFLILWNSISKKVAFTMTLAVLVFGLGAGYTMKFYGEYQVEKSIEIFDANFQALK